MDRPDIEEFLEACKKKVPGPPEIKPAYTANFFLECNINAESIAQYAIEQEQKAAMYKELFEATEGVKRFMTMPRDYYDDNCEYEDEYHTALKRYKEAQRQLKEEKHD